MTQTRNGTATSVGAKSSHTLLNIQQHPCCCSILFPQGGKGSEDCVAALSALFHVLLLMTKVMAPFTPFITEMMYQNLRRCLLQGSSQQQQQEEVPESVHFCDMPAVEQVRGRGESSWQKAAGTWVRQPGGGGVAVASGSTSEAGSLSR